MPQADPPETFSRRGALGIGSSEPGALPRRVRWARLVAGGNVVGFGLGAVLSLALELPGISLIGVALSALAWNEWRGRKLLLAADARAPRRLALNQLSSMVVVVLYCAVGAYAAWVGPSPLDAVLREQPELGEALHGAGASSSDLNEWARSAALAVYGAMAVGSLVVQGLIAALYLSLRPALEPLR